VLGTGKSGQKTYCDLLQYTFARDNRETTNIFHNIESVAEVQTARLRNTSKKLYSCTDCSLTSIDQDNDAFKVFVVFSPSRQIS
jgi:hypothetical protein